MEIEEGISFLQVVYSFKDKEWHIKEINVKDMNAYYSKEEAVRVAIELAQAVRTPHSHLVMVQREDGIEDGVFPKSPSFF